MKRRSKTKFPNQVIILWVLHNEEQIMGGIYYRMDSAKSAQQYYLTLLGPQTKFILDKTKTRKALLRI
jgi:hypothetical protein